MFFRKSKQEEHRCHEQYLKKEVEKLQEVIETLHVQNFNLKKDLERVTKQRDSFKLTNLTLRENIRNLNGAVIKKHHCNKKLKAVLAELRRGKPKKTKKAK